MYIVILIIIGLILMKILNNAIAPTYTCRDCKKTHSGFTIGECPYCGGRIFGGYS